MIPPNPSRLIAAAAALVGLGEVGGNNRGPLPELCLHDVGQPAGEPWCAAFVYHVGHAAHFDDLTQESGWPLPRTASCWELGEFAKQRGVLVDAPRAGDVFLLYSRKLGRFAHTGIVVAVLPATESTKPGTYDCLTIEGNTAGDGTREGDATLRQRRRFVTAAGDRFIRWTALGARDEGSGTREAAA